MNDPQIERLWAVAGFLLVMTVLAGAVLRAAGVQDVAP